MDAGVVNAYWDGPDLAIVERDGAGRVTTRRRAAEFSCFVAAADLTRGLYKQLRDSGYVRAIRPEGQWVRLCWSDYGARARGCQWLEEHAGVGTREGGIGPVRRWMVDEEVRPVKPRLAYFDLETDSSLPFRDKEKMRIFCCDVRPHGADEHRIFTLDDDSDAAEARLLQQLFAYLDQFDQLAAWNGARFDEVVLRARLKHCGLWPLYRAWKRWLWLDQLVIFKRMHQAESGDEKVSFALDNVGHELLGRGKAAFDASRTREAYDAGGRARSGMYAYCAEDVKLQADIEAKTGYLELHQTICETMGVFSDTRGCRPVPQVESFVMRASKPRGYRWPTRRPENEEEREQFKGAFVMKPPKAGGILRDVHVLDFSSMYPSIIVTWNMSPETVVRERPQDPNISRPLYLPRVKWDGPPRPEHVAEAPGTGVWFDQREQGMMPEAVLELLVQRKYFSQLQASLPPYTPAWWDAGRKSTAFKTDANAVFGASGNEYSITHEREVAESITQAGAWLIHQTLDAARERGWEVVYGDTDSAMIRGCTEEEVREFREWCEAVLYPRLLDERGCHPDRRRVSIAYEKAYEWVIFTSAKRYVAKLKHYKGTRATADSKPEVKGLEYRRGDSSRICRRMQWDAIQLLLTGRHEPAEFHELVLRWRQRVLEGELERDEFVLSKGLSKSLKEYGSEQVHVAVAKQLDKRGADVGVGTRVEYVVVDGSVSPMQAVPVGDYEPGTEDRHYLWEKQAWPATARLLAAAFPAEDWRRYDKSRPPKARRGQAPKPVEGQMALGGLLDTVKR